VRVLILGLNYLPESTSIGPYTADLAGHLLAAGHDVQVITGFPMAPCWKVREEYRGQRFRRETIDGVPVLRTYLYVPSEPRKTLNRILFDMSFTASALLGALSSGPCDLVVAVSPPLQLGITAWLVAKFKKAPFFFHIQDLVPDAAVATGALSEEGMATKVARAMESFVYRRARGIGVICEGFETNLRGKGVHPDKIKLLPNSVDLDFIRPLPISNGFRARHSIDPDEFLVMYSGSVAPKQGLENLVEAAALLKDEPQLTIMIVGEGPCLGDLRNLASQRQLSNLRFLPLQPRAHLPEQLSAANVLAMTQRRSVTDIVFPGKLLYYMAAGRPILASVSEDSETGRFISHHGVGVVTPPEDPASMAEAILRLRNEAALEMGHKGRTTVEQHFDRKVVLPSFVRHLESLVR